MLSCSSEILCGNKLLFFDKNNHFLQFLSTVYYCVVLKYTLKDLKVNDQIIKSRNFFNIKTDFSKKRVDFI